MHRLPRALALVAACPLVVSSGAHSFLGSRLWRAAARAVSFSPIEPA